MAAQTIRNRMQPWTFLAPFLLLFVAFLLVPLIYAVYISFFVRRMGVLYFVGFQNYITAIQDHQFWVSIVRVFFYGVVQGVIMIALALLLALLLDTKWAKFKSLFRLMFLLPYAVPGVFASILWGFLYSKSMNPLLHNLKFNPLSSGFLLYAIVNIATWEWAGYNMILYIASLTGVSTELYEAAKLDGCDEWQLARFIKLPLLKPTIVMTCILSFIGSMQLFNEPFLLTALTPISPDFTPNIYIYNMAFSMTNLPYAATLSVFLALITILISVIALTVNRLWRRRTPTAGAGASAAPAA